MNRGVAQCLAAALLFGATTPLASRLVDDVGPFTLAGLLYVGAALAVGPFVARRWPSTSAWRRSGRRIGGAVVLGGGLGPVALAMALDRVPAASASLLLNLELVLTLVVAGLFFREHLGPAVLGGGAAVLAGGVLLGWSGGPDVRWGALLIAAACLCWALDNCITAAIDQLPPEAVTLCKGVVAGSVNVAIGVVAQGLPELRPTLAAMCLGAVGYGASITLWVRGAQQLGAARAQVVFAMAPFLGVAVAWLVLDEQVLSRQLIAGVLTVAGLVVVLRGSHEHEHRHDPLDHDHEHTHGGAADDGHHQGPDHVHDPPFSGRHAHPHHHEPVVHRHVHVPDLHHRHDH